MAKKGLLYILTAALMMGALTGCKQNVGTPEDNAVVEEPEENDDVQTNRLFGFSGADLSDPFCEVIKDSVSVSLEEQGDRILVRDAAKDAGTQAEQIREMINAGKATFYIGFDPTADSLHVGHFMQLIVMRKMQQAGHRPIVLLGGGTTMVGDPTGKTDMRKMLTKE